MAIEGVGSKPSTATPERNRVRNDQNGTVPASRSGAATTANTTEDQLSLTGTVQQLQSLEAHLAKIPAYDAGKVATLKNSMKNGDYQANPQRIADKIITLEQGLSAVYK